VNALARSKYTLTVLAAVGILAGCGGVSGNPLGSTGLTPSQTVVPLETTATYTALLKSKPFQGAKIYLRKGSVTTPCTGAYIRQGRTDAKGQVVFTGFNRDQWICLGIDAEWHAPGKVCFDRTWAAYFPNNVPRKHTFRLSCNEGS
jgi:hypothetical protein